MPHLLASLPLVAAGLTVVLAAITSAGSHNHAAVTMNGLTIQPRVCGDRRACWVLLARYGRPTQRWTEPGRVEAREGTKVTLAVWHALRGTSQPSHARRSGRSPFARSGAVLRDSVDEAPVLLLYSGAASWSDRPLTELSPAAAASLQTHTGRVGVAVVVPARGAVYTDNAEILFPMASVAKVAIMAAVMDRAAQEERTLTEDEHAWLELMITVSDNDAASVLWSQVGGGEGVERSLRAHGLLAIHPDPGDAWGASAASAKDVALLFAKLTGGEMAREPFRSEALHLLSRVVPAQRWGVTAGMPALYLESGHLGIKNGWYPAEDGWRVHSAGVVVPADGSPGYVVAIMTDNQPSMVAGIETIEAVASLLHRELHGSVDAEPVP